MNCPKCNSGTIKNGQAKSGDGQRYKCKECRYEFTIKEVKDHPNVLIFDLETSLLRGWFFSVWKQNIQPAQIDTDMFLLTWSAKWLNEPTVYSGKLTSEEAKKQDDSRIVKDLWKFIEAADCIIAHNLLGFDQKVMNTRFLMNGLNPPTPYRVIDTLAILKKRFRFTYNRLDWIHKKIQGQGKIKTDIQLWIDCYNGNEEALQQMSTYNDQDVLVLEDVYMLLRPWAHSHPNINLYVESDGPACPTCGSIDLNWQGKYTTAVNSYSSFRCNNCGAIGRSRHTELTKQDKIKILQSIAR